MGHQLNLKAFFPSDEMTTMSLPGEKCKIAWSWDDVLKDMQETL
jgi:hypothetical protein